jgi:hypothetical protein
MSSKLKLFSAALLAVVLLVATNASGATAAEFHCSVTGSCRVTLKPDGTGKTEHQTFMFTRALPEGGAEAVGFTCTSITGEATMPENKAKELTITGIEYHECSSVGLVAAVRMNGCDYLLGAAGQLSIKCPFGKKIEWEVIGCVVTLGEQGPIGGPSFHDAGTTKSELTVQSQTEKKLKGTIIEGCAMKPGEFTAGEISTGNFILTAEKGNPAGEMVNIWWE